MKSSGLTMKINEGNLTIYARPFLMWLIIKAYGYELKICPYNKYSNIKVMSVTEKMRYRKPQSINIQHKQLNEKMFMDPVI